MSSLIVEVARIDEILPHPNADALELARIKGWQCCVVKGKYQGGDLVTYIPIDAVIPEEHSDRWGITKYLSKGRVRCARLRGEPSFGVLIEPEDPAWAEGQDVAEHYGITKYEPPLKIMAGDAAPRHPLFVMYTDIENLRNFPDVLGGSEEVVATEKIHGTNCRVAVIEGEEMAGSMSVRRKRPEEGAGSIYWHPWSLPPVANLLRALSAAHAQVILFGEIYGSRIQSLNYGCVGTLGYRAFDLLVDGRYVDWEVFNFTCRSHGVETAPVLYEGPYSLVKIAEVARGNTTLGADHIREGIVVKPIVERTDPKVGRVALKYLSDDYMLSKGISDSRDV